MTMLKREDGAEIYYEVHGEGPAILLSHGFSATSQMWRDQVAPLSRDHRLILWDMRGHGRSAYPDDQSLYSEAATVDDMAAILDAAGERMAIVGGLSLGGYMSLAFHRLHPERVRALMVFDTGPGYRKDEPREAWNANAIRRAERYEAEGLGDLSRASREVRTATHRDATGLARAARGMLTQRDGAVLESLSTITVPTLVLAGADDTPFLAATDYMAGKIPGAQKVIVPAAGHAANIDQPEAFNRAVMSFLQGLAA
jgi:pimeloyl-ACP methyl ester carboxylesterase